MKHCCTHTDTNLMIHLLPVNFSPAKMMLLCINSIKVNLYAGIFPPSVKMVLTEEDEVIIALWLCMFNYYGCCHAKLGRTTGDAKFHRFSSSRHNSISFSISVFEKTLSAMLYV